MECDLRVAKESGMVWGMALFGNRARKRVYYTIVVNSML